LNRIQKYLKMLDLEHKNQPIGELSKGMKRKVLIARSLLNDPEILIYDEPASGLDPVTANSILDFMKKLKKQGKAILFSTHYLNQAENVSDRVIIMNKGLKIYDGTINKLTAHENRYILTNKDGKEFEANYDEMKVAISEGNATDVRKSEMTLEQVFLRLVK
jgi:ABC-2 type transport system ATP-binding protein